MKALVFQLLESTALSSHWFQISTCTPLQFEKTLVKKLKAAGANDVVGHGMGIARESVFCSGVNALDVTRRRSLLYILRVPPAHYTSDTSVAAFR